MRRNGDPSQLVCKIATPEPDIPIRRRQKRGQVERVQTLSLRHELSTFVTRIMDAKIGHGIS